MSLILKMFTYSPFSSFNFNYGSSSNTNTNVKKEDKFNEVVNYVKMINHNQDAIKLAREYNLNIQSVAWEDTARNKYSSVGPNISDMTLNVASHRMPLIRSKNYTDVTVDMPFDKLPNLVVGNHNNTPLTQTNLKNYLDNLSQFMKTDPDQGSLFIERDKFILTSAQACVLPLHEDQVGFSVDLYNYQSSYEPAVLVIIATAQGTSSCIVKGGNTKLYFNRNDTACLFSAKRITDHRKEQGRPLDGPMTKEEKAMNGIYIFQIPLVCTGTEREPIKLQSYTIAYDGEESFIEKGAKYFAKPNASSPIRSLGLSNQSESYKPKGAERAIISVGESQGKFNGIQLYGKPYKMVRDVRYPIRLTVQFYVVTDENKIGRNLMIEIAEQIRSIYEHGVNESSMVVDHVVPKPGTINSPTSNPRPTAITSDIVDLPTMVVDNGLL